MAAPEAFQIKLSAQQCFDFTACAKACGLDLAAWIVQCADVQAAAAIDAMQAGQRGQRPDRKKQRPRLRVEHTVDEKPTGDKGLVKNSAQSPVAGGPAAKDPPPNSATVKSLIQNAGAWNITGKSATMKAARTYNKSFRRRDDESQLHGRK
jgi:hypothetical protein